MRAPLFTAPRAHHSSTRPTPRLTPRARPASQALDAGLGALPVAEARAPLLASEAASSSSAIASTATLVAAAGPAASTDVCGATAASVPPVVSTSGHAAAATTNHLATPTPIIAAPSAATTPPSPEAVAKAVAAGEEKAKAQAGRDSTDFVDEKTVFPDRVTVAGREAAWMRVEISKLLHVDVCSSPPTLGTRCVVLNKPLINRRGGDGPAAALRARPVIYNYVVDGQRVYITNLASKEANLILAESGLGSLPCGNPDCNGSSVCPGSRRTWHTSVKRWSVTTAAPAVLIEGSGFSSALVSARSICHDCNQQFSHVHPVVLRRLLEVSNPYPKPPLPSLPTPR